MSEVLVDDGHFGSVGAVVPGEVAAGEQAGTGRIQIARRHGEVFSVHNAVGGAKVGGAFAIDIGIVVAAAEWHVVDYADGSDAGDACGFVDDATLHRKSGGVGVAGHVQFFEGQHHILGVETDGCVQGALHAAKRDQRSCDEQGAEGDLNAKKQVAEREPAQKG